MVKYAENPVIEDAEKLRRCIARFERLRDTADPDMARVYAAEIAADHAMLADIESQRAQRLQAVTHAA